MARRIFFNRDDSTQGANPDPAAEKRNVFGHILHFGRSTPENNAAAGALPTSKRPPFGQWLKATWLDIVTMAFIGATGLGVYFLPPAPSRSFPSKLFAQASLVHIL